MVTTDDVIDTAVAQLNDNKIVAWMHGRMEFGARALGNRSILASPLNPYSTENLNAFIKHREQVRKFAASVPAELCAEYFDAGPNARFLATVGRVRPAHRERFAAAIVAGRPDPGTHGGSATRTRSTGACCTRPANPPACRCSTTRRSTSSASRWCARLGTPSAASIRAASTRSSSGTSSCRSNPGSRARDLRSWQRCDVCAWSLLLRRP